MGRVISKKTIEDIRFRNDIAEVIGGYFHLQRAGATLKALCPFHKEKTPSFHVNAPRQIFHCFGCGAGGDVFKFIMMYEGVDFNMAVKMLAQRGGIKLELEEGGEEHSDKDLLYKLHSEVAALYHKILLEDRNAEAGRKYLAGRDLGDEMVREFQIGFAPDQWEFIVNWAEKNKYNPDLVERAGLIMKKTDGGAEPHYYDRFRNRLMFPITDEHGRVIGFSGRCLEQDPKAAKYVNSPETPLFHKSRILYALSKARRHIVEAREAIICEGQIDVIRCHQAGFTTAVASQGTAFTEDHARILQRYADSVVVVFDPDKAGQDAAIRTAVIFMSAGLAVRAAILPEKEDPDLFIRKRGAEAFRKLLDGAMSAVAFQVAVLSKRENIGAEAGLMRAAKAVLQTIKHSPNAVQREKLVQEAAAKLNVRPSTLLEELRKMTYGGGPVAAVQEAPVKTDASAPPEEIGLCEHLVHYVDDPALIEIVGKYMPTKKISNQFCRIVVECAIKAAGKGADIQEVLRDHDDEPGDFQKFVAGLLMAPSRVGIEHSRQEAVKDIILYIWRRELLKEREELDRKGQANLTPKEGERRRQITYDLKALSKWDSAVPILEIELAG